MFDLLLRGGRVVDPASAVDGVRDIAVSDGRIAKIAPNIAAIEATRVIDVKDKLVVPGLIDLHAHVFDGFNRSGVHPDLAGVYSGVTTLVDAGSAGCAAATTAVEVRRSADGLTWGDPVTAALTQSGLWAWHIDVQWIAARNEFWAVYNVKTEGSCTTPAVYIASSADGVSWDVAPGAVMVKGTARELQDIVYRTTFAYDPAADAITFWYSGARFTDGQYRWGAAVQRRLRQDIFSESRASLDPRSLPPAPAPLEDWP